MYLQLWTYVQLKHDAITQWGIILRIQNQSQPKSQTIKMNVLVSMHEHSQAKQRKNILQAITSVWSSNFNRSGDCLINNSSTVTHNNATHKLTTYPNIFCKSSLSIATRLRFNTTWVNAKNNRETKTLYNNNV